MTKREVRINIILNKYGKYREKYGEIGEPEKISDFLIWLLDEELIKEVRIDYDCMAKEG